MENALIKAFVNYLFKMVIFFLRKGIVGIKSLKDLLQSIDRNKNKLRELGLASILYDYLANINEEQLEEISKQIVANYSSDLREKNEKLLKILKKATVRVIKPSFIAIKESLFSFKIDSKTILTTHELKELSELRDCTFQYIHSKD